MHYTVYKNRLVELEYDFNTNGQTVLVGANYVADNSSLTELELEDLEHHISFDVSEDQIKELAFYKAVKGKG